MGVVVHLGGRESDIQWDFAEGWTTNPVEYGTVLSSIIFHQCCMHEQQRYF